MKPESHADRILPVVADSTQRKFTLLLVSLSLVVFLLIYLVSATFSPLIYLKVVDEPDCPPSFTNYNRFCHRYDLSSPTSWFGTVYGLNKTNSLIILGATFELLPALQNTSALTSLLLRGQLHLHLLPPHRQGQLDLPRRR